MHERAESVDELSQEHLAGFLIDIMHRIIVHHVFWFREVEHQMGQERALQAMQDAYSNGYNVHMKRLAKELGFSLGQQGLPQPLLDMDRDRLLQLVDSVAKNWLATDGVWFLSVEDKFGMNEAKRCNDSCWAHFSPFEAWSIKRLLGLPEQPGLEGLKQALKFRIYARLNVQSIVEESENSFQFQMNVCRVQAARKRKELDDYPCKSAGLVEYSYFARSIDSRIQTECIGCPPDPHPEEWFCAWRFSIPEEE